MTTPEPPRSESDALLRVLDLEGGLLSGREAPALSDEELVRVLETMLLVRALDEAMTARAQRGELGLYLPSAGHEASHLAVQPLSERDWVFPSHREPGAWLWRGHAVDDLVAQLLGTAADPLGGRRMPMYRSDRGHRLVSVSAPVGTQLPQAVGAAHAAKLQGTDEVAMAFCGAGAAVTGDFHVAMNFAGVYRVPAVVVVRHQLGGEHDRAVPGSFAGRARGYGVPAVRVDGADVLAVIAAASEAVARARAGDGATLVEVVLTAQARSGADPAGAGDEDSRDPIALAQAYLEGRGLWDQDRARACRDRHSHAIARALAQAEGAGAPDLASMFDHVYEAPPWHLAEQRRAALTGGRHGDD
ncbi:thiamine pyrophosphate-dependent dehydrogenase E1 component subunit alpha [Haliangium sp.]|uniref:thiamine pyrophosphate-dependent dehydrogenase E1 component subunit alpha n=1 Tax=Haliangium sp. TaxID=2663208 RepID=UPI003D0D5EDA